MSIVAACGKTEPARGGLMLIVSTDGPVTLGRLDVEVDENDKALLSNHYRVPGETTLPTTIAVVSNGKPTAQVKLTVTAWKDRDGTVPLDRRDEIVTQVPTDRVVTLAVVLSTLCTDKVTVDKDGIAQSTCASGTTCDGLGDCRSTTVVATRLPSYHAGDENDAGVVDTLGAGGSGGAGAGGGHGEAGTGAESGEGGEAGGGAVADPCLGKVCDAPPDNDCASATQFKAYDKIGSCSAGECSYASQTIACTCQAQACTTDPCLKVTCDTPPDPVCKDASALTTYAKSGTCSGGSCSYVATDVTCAFGCTGGACKPDPCAAVACNVQQAAACKDGNTQTTYASMGTCSGGSCSYVAADMACAFGCASGACKPDPCATVTCNLQQAAVCKDANTQTTSASAGTCSAGTCNYAATSSACGNNKQCGGAGVCSVCKTDTSCGATCAACASGTAKCKDLGTTSQCVGCLLDADCSGATPLCNTANNTCMAHPSCVGLAATCGPSGTSDCCASSVVTGGTFNRGNDANYPATVSDFRLDNYEITVGRFRKFVAVYSPTMTPPGAGKNPNNPSDTGWDFSFNNGLETSVANLTAALKCNSTFQTWTDVVYAGPGETLPINCLDWFEAEAFCIWDGGRLPTEAEWNYAAAGGAEQRPYPWGTAAPDCSYANFYNNSYYCLSPNGGPLRVGAESPKGDGKFGQSDLAGNVYEWAQDWYLDPYATPCNNCAYLTPISNRIHRGGGFADFGSDLVSSERSLYPPSAHGVVSGARCARAR